MELMSQGAEAKIYLDDGMIIKDRFLKSYRHPKIDSSLRKSRTRREAKVISKLPEGVPGPSLISMDDRDMKIEMEYIAGPKVRDVLDDKVILAEEIGRKLALLHNAGIIHGDLTTSNMIYKEGQVFFIDFGLSFFSEHFEDKAVDLHLFRQALLSKHHEIFEKAYELFLQGYRSECSDPKTVMNRLEKVEKRGRHKQKH